MVSQLVLIATSGGIDTSRHRPADWRKDLIASHPSMPRWFVDHDEDLSPMIRSIVIPTLLLWGDADPISPVGIGRELGSMIRGSDLQIISGGDHGMANTMADVIAPLVQRHINGPII
jgi:pimeloyl-ACP methyl ester carboxylesterase